MRQRKLFLTAVFCLGLAAYFQGLEVGERILAEVADLPTPELQTEGFDWNEVLKLKRYLTGYPAFLSQRDADKLAYAVHTASMNYDISPEMILAVIATESAFKTEAISCKGAVGLMQIMPSTGRYLAQELSVCWDGHKTLTDPAMNIMFGTFYLKTLTRTFRDIETALLAYNFGPTKIAEQMATEDFELASFKYPKKVLKENWPVLPQTASF